MTSHNFYIQKMTALQDLNNILNIGKEKGITFSYRKLLSEFELKYGFTKIIKEKIKAHIDMGEYQLIGDILSPIGRKERKDEGYQSDD